MPTITSSPTAPAALVLARQPGELRDPRLDRAPARPVAADVRLHRHRPGREDDLGRDARPGAAVPDGPRAPRRARLPEDDRQARHPDLDPDRARSTTSRRRAPGSSACRGRSARPCRSSSPGSGRRVRARAGPGSITPRTRSIKTLVAPYCVRPAAGAPGLGADHAGTSSTTRSCGPTAGRSGPSSSASPKVGDLFAAAQTDLQELPPV